MAMCPSNISQFILNLHIVQTIQIRMIVKIIFAVVFITQYSTALLLDDPLPVVQCQLIETSNSACVFDRIQITRDSPRFQPNTSNPEYITWVSFSSGFFEIFSAQDICNYFPNLETIRVNLAVEEVAPNGLAACRKLKIFDHSPDKPGNLREIPSEFFQLAPALEDISIDSVPLRKVQPDQFKGLKKLWNLSIIGTLIDEFPYTGIEVDSLKFLWLYSNRLKDFPAEQIAEKSGLWLVAYSDNDILCSRVKEITDLLEMTPIESRINSLNRDREEGQETGEYKLITCVL